jgi:hypothetical protein
MGLAYDENNDIHGVWLSERYPDKYPREVVDLIEKNQRDAMSEHGRADRCQANLEVELPHLNLQHLTLHFINFSK